MYRKLIVPLDGSDEAEGVLPFVEDLAAKLNFEIVLIVVSPVHNISLPRLLSKYVETVAMQLSTKGFKTTTTLLPGNPGQEIINYTNSNSDGILAMANYGGSGSSHWLLGDLIDKIATRTTVPLLLIPEKRIALGNFGSLFNRILIPLDTSAEGEAGVSYAIELAKKANSKIFLIHVISPIYKGYGLPGYAVTFEKQLLETLHNEGENYLKDVTNNLTKKNMEIKYDLLSGSPAEMILTYAEEHLLDSIVISTHGRSGIKRFVLGSVARQVIFSSDIPVFLVRAIGGKIQSI